MKRFSKSIFLTILVIAMAIALVGCKTASVSKGEEVVEPAPVEPAPVEPSPAPTPEPAPAPTPEPAPAPAPVEEPIVVSLEPIVQRYILGNSEIVVKAELGKAEVTYPAALFTEEELVAALTYAVETYPALVNLVTYDYKPGDITFRYPEEWGVADYKYAENLVLGYVDAALASIAAEQETELVPETPAAAPEAEALKYTLSLYGYQATIVYANGTAIITYPEFITNEEVMGAAALAYQAYADYLQGTELIVDNGTAVLTLPFELAEADVDYAVNVAAAEIQYYVNSLIGGTETIKVAAKSYEAEAVETAEVVAAIEKALNLYGFEATISYKDKVATITYPEFITNAEIADAAKMAYAAYSQYLQGTELTINKGTAILTFPVDITEADIDYAVALLEAELPAYVAAVLATPQPVATVAEQPAAEQPAAAEAPAATQPAATTPAATTPAATTTTTTTTTTPAASTTTTTTTPAAATSSAAASTASTSAAAQKKSNVGLIIVIIVLVVAAAAACFILLKKKKK